MVRNPFRLPSAASLWLSGLLSGLCPLAGQAQDADTLTADSRPRLTLKYAPGRVVATDKYMKKWLQEGETHALSLETTLPLSVAGDAEPQLWGGAYLSAGLRYSLNHGTTMHRYADPSWGQLVPVDYDSHLGNVLTLYGTLTRPFLHTRHWEVAYYIGTGIGYSHHIYNKTDAIDNEIIGSHLNIFFTAGLQAAFHVSQDLDFVGGVDFAHHSNGALARPNKGANYVSPFLGVRLPVGSGRERQASASVASRPDSLRFRPYTFLDFTVGIGGKTLLEDWQQTQFDTPPTHPDYRTDDFHFYMAYSLQADILRRWHRKFATGLGIDLFYGSYSSHVAELDRSNGYDERHSPWSVGLAVAHRAYFGRLSMHGGIGYYLFRHMGHGARELEKPYYERIGLHYLLPGLGGVSLGFSINAHATKADFTELQLSVPVRL